MSTSDEGYQRVIDGLDGVCERFTFLTRQMDFAEIQRNIEIVSKQSKSQKEMLERLRGKIETLTDRNDLLECQNLALQVVCEKICGSGTEDENGSEEKIEEPIRSISHGEDMEAETTKVIDEILREIVDKAFVDVEKRRKRKSVIDNILRQIEDNVFVDLDLETPKFKSRDLNKKDQFLSAEFLHQVILGFVSSPTIQQFTTPEGYPVQMKSHLWWEDLEHGLKDKMIAFMEHLPDSYLNIGQFKTLEFDTTDQSLSAEILHRIFAKNPTIEPLTGDPIDESLWPQIRASKFNPLTDLEIEFEAEGGGEDKDKKGLRIWNASPDQITMIVDYIGKNFFLDGGGDFKKRKFKNLFNRVSGDAFTADNLKNSIAVIVHNFLNGKLSSFKPDEGSTFQTRLGEDPSWGPDGENYKERTVKYLATEVFSDMLKAP